MSSQKQMKEDISDALIACSVKNIDENIEIVYRAHLNDPLDMPYEDLINYIKYKLK